MQMATLNPCHTPRAFGLAGAVPLLLAGGTRRPPATAAPAAHQKKGTSLATPAILLVDDHELVRFGLRRLFEDLELGPIDVYEAESLGAATRLYEELENRLAVVVLDLNLPDTKGLAGLRAFTRKYKASKVVVLSGSVDDAIASEALAIGAEAFLHKASDTALLRDTLRRIIGESLGSPQRPSPPPSPGGSQESPAMQKRMALSPRELQILELVLQGCSNQEIGEATGLAAGTAKNYISGLFATFGVTSRSKLIALFH